MTTATAAKLLSNEEKLQIRDHILRSYAEKNINFFLRKVPGNLAVAYAKTANDVLCSLPDDQQDDFVSFLMDSRLGAME